MAGVIDQIRKKGTDPSLYEGEGNYDAEAGMPAGASGGTLRERDVAANPVNPSEPAPPARNLRK